MFTISEWKKYNNDADVDQPQDARKETAKKQEPPAPVEPANSGIGSMSNKDDMEDKEDGPPK